MRAHVFGDRAALTAVPDTAAFEDLLQFVYLTPVGIVKFDADGTVDLMNPTALQLLLPLAPDGDLANFFDSVAPLGADLRQQVGAFAGDAGIILGRQRFETRIGSRRTVLSLTVQRISAAVFMAVLEDVTTIVEQERKLAADQQRFRAIFTYVHDYAIYTISTAGLIEEWNDSLERFGGWTAADIEGRHVALFFPGDGDDAGMPDANALLAQATAGGSVEHEGWLLNADGSRLWGNMVITPLPDETGSPRGFVVVARDMTERKRMEDDLLRLATIDPLTGAFNRRHGTAVLTAEFERRSRMRQSFAVLMLDIDRFKSVNDLYGHEVGDTVLCAMVAACNSKLRVLDMFARWGGEEFLAVLPGANTDGALVTAERLRATIETMLVPITGERTIGFTVSIGVAVPASDDAAELLQRVDDALYSAKHAGRNRVVLAG